MTSTKTSGSVTYVDDPRWTLEKSLVVDYNAGVPIQAHATGVASIPIEHLSLQPWIQSELKSFLLSMEPFLLLGDGWGGPHCKVPSDMSVVQAVIGCMNLLGAGFPRPDPKLLDDGTLGVFWNAPNAYAAIDFEEDGVHVWSAATKSSLRSGTWSIGESVPKDLQLPISKQSASETY